MATLISMANGNFSAAGTWFLSDPAALLDSEAGNVVVATAAAWTSGAAFAPGAITIDGLAVKLNARQGALGTITVRLYDVTGGAPVAGTTITLNVADLPTCDATQNEGGWILFAFPGAPVLLLGAGNQYRVEAQTSIAAQVTLWRNGAANNFSRQLRTTTAQAPAAGDILHVMGEHTGAGAGNSFTVTMNIVAATDFGTGVDGSTALTINKRGTLTYGVAAATNYYLKLSGNAIIYNGGTLNTGTVGAEVPRDSTAVLEFDPVADGGMGLLCRNGSTWVMQGLSRTVAKNVVSCLLNVDALVGDNHIHVDTDTGWLDNDYIGVASTTRTYSQCESGQCNGAAGAAIINIKSFPGGGGTLLNAHSGTPPTQAEVILLTRNVKVRSASAAIMAFVSIKPTAIVDIDWVEFYYLGENATGKRGITVETTTGSCDIRYSCLHDCEDYGVYILGTTFNNFTFMYNVLYNTATAAGDVFSITQATTGTSITVDHTIVMLAPLNTVTLGFNLLDLGGTFTNNVVVGSAGPGWALSETAAVGTFTGNSAHSCGSTGFFTGSSVGAVINSTIGTLTVWRCGNPGISLGAFYPICNVVFTTLVAFGNFINNIIIVKAGLVLFINPNIAGDSTFATSYGINFSYSLPPTAAEIVIESGDLGTVAGIKVAHTVADINIDSRCYAGVRCLNTILASATPVSISATAIPGSYVKRQRLDGVAGSHRSFFVYGQILPDARASLGGASLDHFNPVSPSQELLPNNATDKLESGSKKAAVANGGTVTFSVWIRKSAAACGHAGEVNYNGNQPRLVLKKNVAAGIAADVVLDTMAVGLNVWEQLSFVTPAVTDDAVLEAVVDCDGTAGFVNVDTWGVV